jgi:uncharacterized protein
MTSIKVRLMFHGDLPFFLKSNEPEIVRQLTERTSVKDVIEACGVPHTEVDLILADETPVDFAFVVERGCKIDILPFGQNPVTYLQKNRLQLPNIRMFVADGHLGRLVRDLRLLGIADDGQLVKVASEQNRGLLTRDRRLLMHAAVRHGYYLRSQNPLEQTVEVLGRFNLASALAPFSRCLLCNALLEPAEKQKIIGQLEPLTKIYYDQFRRCLGCGQVYWSGSHFQKLQSRIKLIRSRVAIEIGR